jgi:mono/diheme cytochrome c family protein
MCHTPRTAEGELDKANWLKGSTLDFAPIKETKTWHKTAPNLTSSSPLFTRWGDKGLIEFMKTGKNPRGGAADPPMPTYTLSQADAEAVVAYLKSLP